jgi:serine/threonine-protein kinase
MATVHFGRLSGPAGFSRTVAIKRLHPNLAKDPEFVAMFLDEARLAARIRHPNVVPTLDVVATEGEIFLVMDYVQGESLSRLRIAMQDAKRQADPRIIAAIMSGVLHGLHAAHEAKSEQGQSLNIVHRDVSPQNVLVGIEGVARVLDFGVAKAIGRVQTTREGQIKGKLAYMPPEQLRGGRVTRQADVYAAAVVTWEALTGARLFSGEHEGALVTSILMHPIKAPSEVAPHLPAAFDAVVMRGLDRDPAKRYPTAREMALDLERCAGVASTSEVGEWVESLAGTELSKRAALMAAIEGSTPTRPSERIRVPVSSTTSDMRRTLRRR